MPKDHPLRPIREMVDAALKELWPRFEAIYSRVGRPSIPPGKLLRALLLQVFYTIRSERLLSGHSDTSASFRSRSDSCARSLGLDALSFSVAC